MLYSKNYDVARSYYDKNGEDFSFRYEVIIHC